MDHATVIAGVILGAIILGVIVGIWEGITSSFQGTKDEQFQTGVNDHAAGQPPRWWWGRARRIGWKTAEQYQAGIAAYTEGERLRWWWPRAKRGAGRTPNAPGVVEPRCNLLP